MNQVINDKGVCKTSLTKQGLFTSQAKTNYLRTSLFLSQKTEEDLYCTTS